MFVVLCAASALILFGVTLTPEHLISLGIMDQSLLSANEMVRWVAHFEVSILKWGSVVLGAICALIGLNWNRIHSSPRYIEFVSADKRYHPAYERLISRFFTWESLALFGLIALSFVYLIYGDSQLTLRTRLLINKEDGVIEATSAVLLLVASGLCLFVGFSKQPRFASRAMHFFLALLFFVMAGEEISWGQRYLGIETPEAIKEINIQGETNFHNLFGYFFDHLFILGFFIWGCIIPLLDRTSRLARNIFRSVGLPIPGVGIAVCMLIATLTQDQLLRLFALSVDGLRAPELREFISAAAFAAIALQSLRGLVWQTQTQEENNLRGVGVAGE